MLWEISEDLKKRCKPKVRRMNNSKTYKKIIGKDARMISVMVMGVIFGVLLVLVAIAGICLNVFAFENIDIVFLIFTIVFLAFGIFMCLGFVPIFANAGRHSKELKAKYERLLQDEKDEVNNIAKQYSGYTVNFSKNFVYGNMTILKGKLNVPAKALCFEYLKYTDIAQMYLARSKEDVKREQKLAGGIGGIFLGLVTVCFREDTMKTMGLPNYDRPMTIGNAEPQIDNYVHLIMYDGTHFRGKCNQMVFDTIKAHMQSVNPGCRFGKEKVE